MAGKIIFPLQIDTKAVKSSMGLFWNVMKSWVLLQSVSWMRPEATHEDPVRSTIYKIVVICLKTF